MIYRKLSEQEICRAAVCRVPAPPGCYQLLAQTRRAVANSGRAFHRPMERRGLCLFGLLLKKHGSNRGRCVRRIFERNAQGLCLGGKPAAGKGRDYLDLSSLHVSAELRGRGTGRELFARAADWARERGAKKLYISAHSAVETQAFYKALGCVEAEEYNPEHVEQEPFDCQMEFVL